MAKISINLKEGAIAADDIVVGIDLGTTNSLVAFWDSDAGMPSLIPLSAESNLLPSVVYFDATGNSLVGDAAKEYMIADPLNTVYSIKSLIGRNNIDIQKSGVAFQYALSPGPDENPVTVQIQNRTYTPVDISARILSELKSKTERHLGRSVSKCVITVPAYFTELQRQETIKACQLARLDPLRIVNEPTAASLAYGIKSTDDSDKLIVVYDLGGGTFDVSVLRLSGGIFEVLATRGDSRLGGDDFDAAILDYWRQAYFNSDADKMLYKSEFKSIKSLAEQSKIKLSKDQTVSIDIIGKDFILTRQVFEQLITPLVDKTIECCRLSLMDAGLSVTDIDEIVLVGGATRTPLVKQKVQSYFNHVLNTSLNPDEVVAMGAAIQAAIISGHLSDYLLLDVTPLAIGLEVADGLMDVLIPRNTKIPNRASRYYTTQKDGQSGIRISVFQGGFNSVAKNTKIGEFTLKGIPAMPAGTPRILVTFSMDSSGVLTVSAIEERSGISQIIEVSALHLQPM